MAERPPYRRKTTLQYSSEGWVMGSNGWLTYDGKLIQHQKTPRQALLASRSIKQDDRREIPA